MSDPGVLSSQDWSELLSSGAQNSSAVAAGTASGLSSASSTPGGQGGGVSWLLILGIALIVLGVAGVGFFIYAQFFANRHGGHGGYNGPADISSRTVADPGDDTEPLEFEDISSHSVGYVDSGKKSFEGVRPAGTVNRTPAPAKAPAPKPTPAKPKPEKTVPNDRDVTAPIPQPKPQVQPQQKAELPKREPSAPVDTADAKPKSQATPVQNSNFDWEKFFNEEDK